MKRTNIEQVKFRKEGKGTFRTLQGRIIKPGQVFFAYPQDIPEAFRDSVKPVDETKREVFEETGVIEDHSFPKFELKETSKGWFDVVNSEGKALNEKKLRKEEAEILVKALEAR